VEDNVRVLTITRMLKTRPRTKYINKNAGISESTWNKSR